MSSVLEPDRDLPLSFYTSTTVISRCVFLSRSGQRRASTMYRAVLMAQGQIVIPVNLHRKFGIKKGTQVCVCERDGVIAIKPIIDEHIRNIAGMAGANGKLHKVLMAGKAKEREL